MAYRRYVRSKRTTRARRARTGVAKLSRYNTYRHRSSAAQASQIYSLARRINRIQKLNKPEIKLVHYNFEDNIAFGETQLLQRTYTLLQDGTNGLASIIDGKFARLNSLVFTMSYRYDDSSYVVTSDTTQRLPQPVYLRLLFVQLKASRQADIAADDLFDTANGFTRTRGPLADGAARVAKILSDRKIMINFNRQTVNKVIRFNYLRNFYKPPAEAYPKGDVRLYIQAWNPNASAANDATTNVILTANVKTAYTDA